MADNYFFCRFLAVFFIFWPFSVSFLTCLQAERDSWTAALRSASHRHMRSHLEELRSRLRAKMDSNPNMASKAAEDAEAFLPPVIGEYCKYPNNHSKFRIIILCTDRKKNPEFCSIH